MTTNGSFLQPTLIGPKLKLQPMQLEDFEPLFKVAADPDVWEQHPDRLRYQEETFRKYFDTGIASGGALTIHFQDQLIGSSRFYDHLPQKKEIKIGYTFLAKSFWGGSYNRELKNLMLTHAFEEVDLVYFEVGEFNLRSQKALLKIGAQQVFVDEISPADAKCRFQILKSDFKGLI